MFFPPRYYHYHYKTSSDNIQYCSSTESELKDLLEEIVNTPLLKIPFWIIKNKDKLKPGVIPVPEHIDNEVGYLKLDSMGIKIDKLTEDQYRYLNSFEEGT